MHTQPRLPDHPDLWKARELATDPNRRRNFANNHATGFTQLDELLYGGGWPAAGLMELLCDVHGIGELRLLASALTRLSRSEARWITWINPPLVPYAPALARIGIDIGKVLLVYPKSHREALWALEQALKSGASSAALAWLDESALTTTDIRRLQLAAVTGSTWTTLFRPAAAADKPSMAELRILVESEPAGRCERLAFTILKRRGGWPTSRIALDIGHAPIRRERAAIGEQLAFWRHRSASTDGYRTAS